VRKPRRPSPDQRKRETTSRPIVRAALKNQDLLRADALILLGYLKALPMERRPNPIPADKDAYIEMEPLTPRAPSRSHSPRAGCFTRIEPCNAFGGPAEPPHQRNRLGAQGPVVSNPAGGLPLLEAFPRNTALELSQCRVQADILFGNEASKDGLRKVLPAQTFSSGRAPQHLIKEYGVHEWTEPLRPALVFLQSCLALTERQGANPFLQRGAIAVVGSSTRTYSGSGGACALAFLTPCTTTAPLWAGSLRHAKNFFWPIPSSRKNGWARTPSRAGPTCVLPGRSHSGRSHVEAAPSLGAGQCSTLDPPQSSGQHHRSHPAGKNPQESGDCEVPVRVKPNGRLAGLLREGDKDGQRLVPFVSRRSTAQGATRQNAPPAQPAPNTRWVFAGTTAANADTCSSRPRTKDKDEIRSRAVASQESRRHFERALGAQGPETEIRPGSCPPAWAFPEKEALHVTDDPLRVTAAAWPPCPSA